ncbi:porin OmpA [Pantoea sp. Aalb]|uniref:porin OmpA n=1 Tax=Pantoea sp. Aalb TaxID=2576762 RepID=UPI001325DBCA|nr:porin OmpA [Pantoea sp. Aalb]MXP67479.1 porin OmpA [Pantoea sp. Aalb]
MKKTAIAIAVALAGFTTVAQAVPKNKTWYTGGKMGWSRYHDTRHFGNDYDHNDGPTKKSQVGVGLILGYQVKEDLAFEVGYDWLGRIAYKGDFINGAFRAHGLQASAKFSYPIFDDVDIYTRLGGMLWRADATESRHLDSERIRDHDTGIAPLLAFGIDYSLAESWVTHLDYQWINRVGDAEVTGSRPDSGMLTLGLSYHFNQVKTIAPVRIIKTKHFHLKSDFLFAFNKATLKEQGKIALENLYKDLSKMNAQDSSIIVLGFTDRIGPDKYNQKLSEQRAQAIVDFLISKNIPYDNITAHGMGKSQSITGHSCDDFKKRKALIECLAPDRRVEINVRGFQDIILHQASIFM